MATNSKTQPAVSDTTASHKDEVKVENISPDTSPNHQSTNKPTNTLLDKTCTKTKQERENNTSTVKNLPVTQTPRKAGSVIQRPKKVIDPSMKTVPLQKDKPKEPTGYAARYFQKRAAEHGTKPIDKEVLTAGILDIDRPLLSPATRESMARKRRSSDKPVSDESLATSLNSNVTSISAPVRRTKPSSLASGKLVLLHYIDTLCLSA